MRGFGRSLTIYEYSRRRVRIYLGAALGGAAAALSTVLFLGGYSLAPSVDPEPRAAVTASPSPGPDVASAPRSSRPHGTSSAPPTAASATLGGAATKGASAPTVPATAMPVSLPTGRPERPRGTVDKLVALPVPRVYRHGPREYKRVALTIDDGWVDDDALLALLEEYGIKCTVFIPGRVAEARPEFIRKLDRAGFEVANHTYNHSYLTQLSDAEIERDVARAQRLITAITGKIYPYLRPPGGDYDDRVLNVLARMGYKVIMWDNDVLGYWPGRPLESQLDYVRGHLAGGNIILSHFGSALRTAEALSILIPEILAAGYEFVTVSELLAPPVDLLQ